jgi:NADH-quinone oxidoreductase subunit E
VSTELLTAQTRSRIDDWVAKFPPEHQRSAIIQSLMAAQEQNGGWLSGELITEVARYLDIPSAWAYEVATFYSMFDLKPVGRHKVNICTNISCMLCGAENLVDHVQNKLGVKLGETTDDGRITLIVEEECLAGCCGAPMMVVDGHYHENMDAEKVDAILDALD